MANKKFELGPLQKKWVEALRSGKYSQTTGKLHDLGEGGYCCLGVACKLLEEPVVKKQYEDDEDPKAYWGKDENEETFEVLPESYRKKFRFFDGSGGYHIDQLTPDERNVVYSIYGIIGETNSLAELNDSGWSFEQLADLIEEYPKLIFAGPA